MRKMQLVLNRKPPTRFDDGTTFTQAREPLHALQPGIQSLNQTLNELITSGFKEIAVAAHPRPDLDAIASMLGFKTIAQMLGIKTSLYVGSDYRKETAALRVRLLTGWYNIKALPVSLLEADTPVILFDTADWRRSELSKEPFRIYDNHNKSEGMHYSAVSTLVAAHLFSRSELGKGFWNSGEGSYLAALLTLGIATDCGYLPNVKATLLKLSEPLPGMKEADWRVFSDLSKFADAKTIANFQYSPFWQELSSKLAFARENSVNTGTAWQKVLVCHLGPMKPFTDDVRSLVADSLLLDNQGLADPTVQAVVVTSQSQTGVTLISARLQQRAGEAASIGLSDFMQTCCGPSNFGVRGSVGGGRALSLAQAGNNPNLVMDTIEREAAALRPVEFERIKVCI